MTNRQFRESLNWSANDVVYGLDVNAADHWIEGGWNVGVYYWREYADETYVQFAEAKIWTTQSPVHMRYRTLLPSPSSPASAEPASPGSEGPYSAPRTSYAYVDASVPCVSEQLAQALQRRFSMGSAPFRLVGHSLGAQLVIHSSTLLSQRAQHDPAIRYALPPLPSSLLRSLHTHHLYAHPYPRTLPPAPPLPSSLPTPPHVPHHRLPTRLALLDPFFTPEPKPWLGWRTLASVLYEEVHDLSKHIVLEQYQVTPNLTLTTTDTPAKTQINQRPLTPFLCASPRRLSSATPPRA